MSESVVLQSSKENSFGGVLMSYALGLIFSGLSAMVLAATLGEKVALGVTPILAFLWAIAHFASRWSVGKDDSGQRIEVLRREMLARNNLTIGLLLGELSLRSDDVGDGNSDLLELSLEHCRVAYEQVKRLGLFEFTALNNLIFFLSARGHEADKEFVLSKARKLREVGEEYGFAPYLMTYCRAVLRYSDDPDELREVREISSKYQFDPRFRAEARDYWRNSSKIALRPVDFREENA